MMDQSYDYAVEVLNRGYVTRSFPDLTLGPEAVYSSDFDVAVAEANRVRDFYRRAGCPEIAEAVRVMQRQVMVTRGEWAPAREQGTST